MAMQTQKRKAKDARLARVLAALAVGLALLLIFLLSRMTDGVSVSQPGLDPANDLPINIRVASEFQRGDDGHISYPGAVAGIDISAHQGEIDWQRVLASGVQFAIVRAGFRGYGEGTLVEDAYFRRNLEQARSAGLELGLYFFSQAISVREAEEEAEFVLTLLGDTQLELPVFFDWEEISDEGSRSAGMDSYAVGDYAAAFCKRIEAGGYTAGVYFNQRYGYTIMQLEQVRDYAFWLAEYRDAPTFLYDITYWQYTGEGLVDGIDTVVDLDLRFAD